MALWMPLGKLKHTLFIAKRAALMTVNTYKVTLKYVQKSWSYTKIPIFFLIFTLYWSVTKQHWIIVYLGHFLMHYKVLNYDEFTVKHSVY